MRKLSEIDELLRVAIRDGVEAEVVRLIAAGSNVNESDGDDPFLILAAKYGHPAIARQLLAAGAAVDGVNRSGSSALYAAIANGQEEIVEMLLAAGANVNAKQRDIGDTPLHYAAVSRNVGIVKRLIDAGANVNAVRDTRDGDQVTPLHLAAEIGVDAIVAMLIDAGARVDALDDKLESPVMGAIRFGHSHVVERLQQAGASLHTQNSYCESPLMVALENRRFDIAAKLLDEGHSPRTMSDGQITPLHRAAKTCGADLIVRLIAAGANACAASSHPQYWTPLHFAAMAGNVPACRALVDAGALTSQLPASPPKDYLTPFQWAVKGRQLDAVRYFVLECGEDLAQRTIGGKTMVQLAGVGSMDFKNALRSLKTELAVAASAGAKPTEAVARAPGRAAVGIL